MKKNFFVALVLLLSGFLLGGLSFYFIVKVVSPAPTYFQSSPRTTGQIIETSRAFSEIVSAVSPAVVNISTTKVIRRNAVPFLEDPFDLFSPFHNFGFSKKYKEQSLGSGLVMSSDGYIITNNHVVEQAEEIKVTLYDKRTFRGKIVGADPKTDVAVIKIDARSLPVIQWADSDKLKVGEFVLAIGNPFGLSHTVTMGIISAVGRANVGIADYEDFIQTDAAINPGNSGGPLVNIKGEAIGINTAIFSKSGGYQGIGFAVPSNMVKLVMEQLLKQGKVTRGWIGVTIQELTPELSQKFGLRDSNGALVADVMKGSPAEKAGLIRGDVITEFNSKEVKDVGSLRNSVAQSRVGTVITARILRGGKILTINLTIAELPKEIAENAPQYFSEETQKEVLAGLTVIDITKEIAKQLGIGTDEKGVVIIRVEQGSVADDAGLKKGDVIQEMNKRKVSSLNDFNRISKDIGAMETVLLFINRGGQKFYVTLKSDQ